MIGDFLSLIFNNLEFQRYSMIALIEFFTCFGFYFVFSWYKKKRKFWYLRLIAAFIVGFFLCLPLGMMRGTWNNIFTKVLSYLVIQTYLLFVLWFTYDESITELLFVSSGVMAARTFASNSYHIIMAIFGVNIGESISLFGNTTPLWYDWVIYGLFEAGLVAIVYFSIRKTEKLHEGIKSLITASVLWGSILVVLIVAPSVIAMYTPSNNDPLYNCCKALLVLASIFAIAIRTGILNVSKTETELEITEEILHNERRHYEEIRGNVEIINAKCHDIKHQLDAFHDKLTDQEIEQLRDAITIYDSNVKTGNEILDLMLYQKGLFCEKYGIKISCIADGSILNGFRKRDLFALLTNAFDNAIEAVQKTEEGKKSITVNVHKDGENAIIEIVNYFNPTVDVVAGTSKSNKSKHGYGTKSMDYIVSRYNGSIEAVKDDDIYYLTISLPIK